ncbi:MAG: lamin tail domain-containing protein [Chlorobiota bacterium]|nr:lamin tail domain-containing protein [Chlorobiota bacterium]QQS65887.1 MAG: lamin tail domain-containing protein [Chlorobiota bacterium]
MRLILFALLFIVCTNLLVSQVLITELMYSPNDPEPEWFELYNNSGSTVNVTDWYVKDNAGKEFVKFSIGNIAPYSYAIVTADSLGFTRAYPDFDCKLTQPIIKWNSFNNTGGDSIIILDNKRNVSEAFYYKDTWGKKGNSSFKYSLQRISLTQSASDSSNWIFNSTSICKASKLLSIDFKNQNNFYLHIVTHLTNGFITIDLPNLYGRKNIYIYNELGILIKENLLLSNDLRVNLGINEFLRGNYFVDLLFGNQHYIGKFILN